MQGLGRFQVRQLALTEERMKKIEEVKRLNPEFSRAQIGEIVGISASNVGKLLTRMRKKEEA